MWSSWPAISAAGAAQGDGAPIHHVHPIGDAQRLSDVLLDEEDADAFVGHVADAGEEPVHDERREAEGQLVGEQHPRVATEGSGQRQHLLLAARHEPGGRFMIGSSSGNSSTASSRRRRPRRRLSATLMSMMTERSSVR